VVALVTGYNSYQDFPQPQQSTECIDGNGNGNGDGHDDGNKSNGSSGSATAAPWRRRPAWRRRRQLGKSVGLAAAATQRQHRQRQHGGGSAAAAAASLAAVAAAWQKRDSSAAAALTNALPLPPKLLLSPRFPTRCHCQQSCASAKLYELGEGYESDTE
jgi:hypothetical protein